MRLSGVSVMAALAVLHALAIPAWTGNTAAIEFAEVAQRAGIRAELRCGGPEKRWIPEANGTGPTWLDYDNDGLMDLLGVAVGDTNNQGRLHILTTTFFDDYFPLFRLNKSGSFDDASTSAGLTMLTRRYLGWACGFADFDNDGKRDLWLANGHVYPRVAQYFQPFVVLRNNGGAFSEAFRFPASPNNSYRGGCAGDFDNDGRVDVAVLPIAGQPLLLQNKTVNSNSWVSVQLRGTRSNRDAIGARVQIGFCGNTQFETVRNRGSYLSHNYPRLHFGLGACAKVERVTVHSGMLRVVNNLAVNRYTTIEEPR